MDKVLYIKKFKKPEEKLLVSKFFDKIDQVKKGNKIETTDFFNEQEQQIIVNVINYFQIDNVVFYGGIDNAERKMAVVFPEKMRALIEEKSFKFETLLSVVRIELSKNLTFEFNHSSYLGALIKLGINRAKIGDIIVKDDGADIIVKKEIEKFLYSNLGSLKRFSDANILTIKLNEISPKILNFKELKIIVSSLRLDSMVAEICSVSRSKANEYLANDRVLVNNSYENKSTKQIKEGDIITVRGKGKFIIEQFADKTQKGNFIILVKKYI